MAFVDVHLAIGAARTGRTAAAIAADLVDAMAAVLAGVRFAFVDLRLATMTGVAGMALARVRVVAVDAVSAIARRRLTVVDVRLAGEAYSGGG